MPVPKTIARNTAFNGAGRLWDAATSLVLTAYIFLKLGAAEYGLWGLVAAFTGYAALFDVGIGSAYAKYIAGHAARDDRDGISSVVSTGFFFYLAFGFVFVAVSWGLVDVLIDLVSRVNPETAGDLGSDQTLRDLGFLVRWGLLLFAVSNCIAPFTAVQTGLQRMGVTNVISVLASFVKIGATVAFLELGFGIRGLMFTNAAVLSFFGALSVVAAFALEPGLRISPRCVTRRTFNSLFQFGWRSQVSRLSNLIMFETDVLVIAFLVRDLQLVGLYKIGVELANKMRQVPMVLLTALLPAASELDARKEDARLRDLYVRSSKYVAFVSIPLITLLVCGAHLALGTWIGTEVELAVAVVVLQIMAFGYLANIVPGAGVAVALGKGRADLQMKAGLISMASNILLTLVLYSVVGFWGIPAATAISMFLSWLWFAGAMGRLLDVSVVEIARRAVLWPFVAAVPGAMVCFACDRLAGDLSGRLASGGIFAGAAVLLGLSYLAVLRKTPFFDGSDLDFFESTLGLNRLPGYRLWARSLRNV